MAGTSEQVEHEFSDYLYFDFDDFDDNYDLFENNKDTVITVVQEQDLLMIIMDEGQKMKCQQRLYSYTMTLNEDVLS